MNGSWQIELEQLMRPLLDGGGQPADQDRLDQLLSENPDALQAYVALMRIDSILRWQSGRDDSDTRRDDAGLFERDLPAETCPLAVSDISVPMPDVHVSPRPSTSASFEWLVSYGVAAVLVAVALLSAWSYKISHFQSEIAVTPSSRAVIDNPDLDFVGRVTGVKDCRWKGDSPGTIVGASVPMGREYALSAGLLEITYNSGAKIILEGPCVYTVDSDASGRLQLGRLVARVEKKVASGQWLVASAKPQAAASNPKSLIPNSQSPAPSPQPLFSVRTPTAVVTDLGTEFGVEVSENGDTISHVFQGTVRVDAIAGDAVENVVLHKNESARVVADENGVRISQTENNFTPPTFVRRVHVIPNQIDLLDIVAGGDGVGSRRERGIDPASGMEDTVFVVGSRGGGDKIYRRVGWHSMIDGVFVPDGGEEATQVDSSGGAFDGFPSTAGEVSYSIWARAADVKKQHNDFADRRGMWIYHILHGERYMPEGRGLLAMHSNAGITFDLRAIRSRHGATPVAFRATAALADRPPTEGGWVDVWKIDVWVIVDGNLKFKREGLRMEDGPVDVNVELDQNDRFLTLAVTDHDRDRRSDCGIFGNPILEMKDK